MLIAQRPTLTEEPISEFRSRFVIEPLEPGFGYTLGNSLRRTLLSSIPGSAVTSIRLDGVSHQFSTVPGVKEDVIEVILNLKNLVVSSEHDEPIAAYLRKQGPGEVTAADVSVPAGVEIHNPDLVIATLGEKAKFELELIIERGRGYVSAAQNRDEFGDAGQIPIDSISSPVLKVTYRVEATRARERTDFDRLVVDVETKQSITPRDAVASAGRTLTELFGLARELNTAAEGIEIGPAPVEAVLSTELSMPIEDLDLSVRSYNCLKREGINTVHELDDRHRRVVALAVADLRDAGVPALTVGDQRRDLGEQDVHDLLVADHGQHATTRVQVPALGEGDEPLGEGTQALGLGLRRLDRLVREQGRGEVGEKQPLVGRAAAEARTLGGGRHVSVSWSVASSPAQPMVSS